MSNVILDASGRATRHVTEVQFDPRLVEMLISLSDLLRQNGLGLHCMKCNRLGQPDGVKADNRPESDTYRLSCGCSVRVFHTRTGREQVLSA